MQDDLSLVHIHYIKDQQDKMYSEFRAHLARFDNHVEREEENDRGNLATLTKIEIALATLAESNKSNTAFRTGIISAIGAGIAIFLQYVFGKLNS